MRHKARILRPMVRKAWLDRSAHSERSFDQTFVACPWDEVLDLLANELSRVRTEHGAGAVFGGSYGWSSAGRFHHAQSQVHRFLNTAFGGYVRSVNSYSAGASAVILPHILGDYEAVSRRNVTWDQVAEHTDTVLAFGGMALKNSDGRQRRHQPAYRARRDAEAPRAAAPCSTASRRCATTCRKRPAPVAADQRRHRHGADAGARPHAGRRKPAGTATSSTAIAPARRSSNAICSAATTTQPKDAAWAAEIVGIPATTIVGLARRLPRGAP